MWKTKTQPETEKGLEDVTEFAKALVNLLLNRGEFAKAQMLLEEAGIQEAEGAVLLDALALDIGALQQEELQLLLQDHGYGKKLFDQFRVLQQKFQ